MHTGMIFTQTFGLLKIQIYGFIYTYIYSHFLNVSHFASLITNQDSVHNNLLGKFYVTSAFFKVPIPYFMQYPRTNLLISCKFNLKKRVYSTDFFLPTNFQYFLSRNFTSAHSLFGLSSEILLIPVVEYFYNQHIFLIYIMRSQKNHKYWQQSSIL